VPGTAGRHQLDEVTVRGSLPDVEHVWPR
jgi:hypothetical protein